MSYLYKFTVSYSTYGPHGTPGPICEYYYNVTTRRRMSSSRYRATRRRIVANARRRVDRLRRKGKFKLRRDRAEVVERTSLEKPMPSRTRKEKIEVRTLVQGKKPRLSKVETMKVPRRRRKEVNK